MKQIALVSSGSVLTVVEYVAESGPNVHCLLENARLSPALREQPDRTIPLVPDLEFLKQTAVYAGDTLMSRNALITHKAISADKVSTVRLLLKPTALEVLDDFVEQSNAVTTSDIRLVQVDNLLWIKHEWQSSLRPPDWQGEQFVVTFFEVALIEILGAKWLPAEIHFMRARKPCVFPREWEEARTNFGQPKTSIAIKLQDIADASIGSLQELAAGNSLPSSHARPALSAKDAILDAILHMVESRRYSLSASPRRSR